MVLLALLERVLGLDGRQLGGVPLTLVQPGPRRVDERGGGVDLLDVDEPGRSQESAIVAAGGDGTRPILPGPAVRGRWQAGCDEDREEGHVTPRAQQPVEGSQHGELGSQSTQHVSVHDGVEGLAPKRQVRR